MIEKGIGNHEGFEIMVIIDGCCEGKFGRIRKIRLELKWVGFLFKQQKFVLKRWRDMILFQVG